MADRDQDQERAIDLLRASLASGRRRPVLQAPTGWGKTAIASRIVRHSLQKGRRVVFTVPALSLVDQTVSMFWEAGIREIGVIQAEHQMTDWSKPVQIASVQTLERRGYPDKCDLAVVDECHRWFRFYERWMTEQPIPFVGLSATPWSKGLGRWFDDLVIAGTISEGITKGYLSPFRVFAPSHVDLEGVRTVGDDYAKGELATKMNTAALVGDVVETWLRRGEDRPTLVFAVDRGHALHLAQRFEAVGVKAAYQDAETDPKDRAEIRRRFHDGSIRVVCSVGTLTTGVDWDVRCIVLARPTKSAILFVQMIGRGLRLAEGKADCLVLDHSDSHDRLGFVTDIGTDRLDDGAVARSWSVPKSRQPKECPQCQFLKRPGELECPECGFVPTRVIEPHDVEARAGQLQELTDCGGTCRVSMRVIELRGQQIPLTVFFGALQTYAKEHRYNPGWAAHKYKLATGSWPTNGVKSAPLCMIPGPVESWIRAQNIRWAKSRQRRDGASA